MKQTRTRHEEPIMRNIPGVHRTSVACLLLTLGLCLTAFTPAARAQQLDDTWTVRFAGGWVPVNASGGFTVSNIPFSKQLRRLLAVGTEGELRYGVSPYFQVSSSTPVIIGDLRFGAHPPLSVRALAMSTSVSQLMVRQQTRVRVTATLTDGNQRDVTAGSSFTSYATSNRNVATVNANGLVTAVSEGVVGITAVNEGVAAVVLLRVVPVAPVTTVIGYVQQSDGTAIQGASVRLFGLPTPSMTDARGRFSFGNVAANITAFQAIATKGSLQGISLAVAPVQNAFTDLGIIVPVSAATFFNGGFETGDLSGFFVTGDAKVVPALGTLTPPQGSSMLLLRTPTRGPSFSKVARPELRIPQGAKTLAFEFNFLTNSLDILDSFRGGFDVFKFGFVTGIPGSKTPIGVVVTTNDMKTNKVTSKPGTGGYKFQTGFLSGKLDVSPMAGKTLPYDFCLRIEHTPLGPNLGSAVLIDNLRFLTQ